MAKQIEKKSRWRRWLLLGVIGVILVVAGGFGWSYWRSYKVLNKTHKVTVEAIEIPEASEYGRYLARHVLGCADCHGEDMGGKLMYDNGAMGVAYSPNITTGKGTVVDGYTVKDWVRSIRHGVARDGRGLLLMPSEDYDELPKYELGALINYLQTAPPVDRESRQSSAGPIMRMLLASGKVQLANAKVEIPETWPEAQRAPTPGWGKVMISLCTRCHGQGLSGGPIPGGKRDWPPASNITWHEDGLSKWTYEGFVKAMKEGKTPDDRQLRDPMPWPAYAGLEDVDLQAMWAYLQTVPGKPKSAE